MNDREPRTGAVRVAVSANLLAHDRFIHAQTICRCSEAAAVGDRREHRETLQSEPGLSHGDCLPEANSELSLRLFIPAMSRGILTLIHTGVAEMRLAIIGATGFVGSRVLQEALDRGHSVTAVVRSTYKLPRHPSLTPRNADAYESSQIAAAVKGHDAVISAFSGGGPIPIFDTITSVDRRRSRQA